MLSSFLSLIKLNIFCCFIGQVLARRKEGSGKVKVLLHWTPEDMWVVLAHTFPSQTFTFGHNLYNEEEKTRFYVKNLPLLVTIKLGAEFRTVTALLGPPVLWRGTSVTCFSYQSTSLDYTLSLKCTTTAQLQHLLPLLFPFATHSPTKKCVFASTEAASRPVVVQRVIAPVVTPSSYIWRKTQAVSPEVYTQCKECLSLHLHIAFSGQRPVRVDLCVALCMFTMCIATVHQHSSLSSLGFTVHLFPSTSTTHKKQTQLLQPRRHHHHSQ